MQGPELLPPDSGLWQPAKVTDAYSGQYTASWELSGISCVRAEREDNATLGLPVCGLGVVFRVGHDAGLGIVGIER